MFDSLRLSVVVTAEVLAEIAAEAVTEVITEAVVEAIVVVLAVVEAMDTDHKNLYVISAQSLIKSICVLLLR